MNLRIVMELTLPLLKFGSADFQSGFAKLEGVKGVRGSYRPTMSGLGVKVQ